MSFFEMLSITLDNICYNDQDELICFHFNIYGKARHQHEFQSQRDQNLDFFSIDTHNSPQRRIQSTLVIDKYFDLNHYQFFVIRSDPL